MRCAPTTACRPAATTRGVAHENGAIESAHGHLKRGDRGCAAAARLARLRRPRRLSRLHRRGGRPPQRPARAKRIDVERAALQALPGRRTADHEETIVTRDLLRRLHAAQGVLHRALAPHRPPAAGPALRRSARGLPRRHASDDAAARPGSRPTASTAMSSTIATSSTRCGASRWRCSASSTATSSSRAQAYRPHLRAACAAACRSARPAASWSALLALAHERGCEAELADRSGHGSRRRPAARTSPSCAPASRPMPAALPEVTVRSSRSPPTRTLGSRAVEGAAA